MAKETTYAGMFGSWQRLIASLKENGADLTHLDVQRTNLEALLAQAVETSKQQDARAAAKQEASKQLRVLAAEGQRLAHLLRLSVKQHYGIRSEKVAEFGVQPFRGRRRKLKPEEEEPQAPNLRQPAPAGRESADDPQR